MFYNKYINTEDRRKYIDDYGSDIFPIIKDKNIYTKKYQETYRNRSHVFSTPYIKDRIILRVYSGIKQKAKGFVYLQGSPYHDAEGSSQIRSCLHDAIINSSPRIGQRIYKLE